jgi:hypothetical protein
MVATILVRIMGQQNTEDRREMTARSPDSGRCDGRWPGGANRSAADIGASGGNRHGNIHAVIVMARMFIESNRAREYLSGKSCPLAFFPGPDNRRKRRLIPRPRKPAAPRLKMPAPAGRATATSE